VLKILSGAITHKSDVGGVAVNLTAEQVGPRMATMVAEVRQNTGIAVERFLVQKMVTGGTEVIVGMDWDPPGMAILVRMGRVTAELF
jgi:acyl-CoA synthetase (NDP forming)